MTMKAWIENISNEEYHAKEGLSASGIKLLLKCPKQYYHRYILKEDNEPTKAMLEGTQFHTFVLEPEEFKKRYYIYPGKLRCDIRSKDYQEVLIAAGHTLVEKVEDEENIKKYQALLTNFGLEAVYIKNKTKSLEIISPKTAKEIIDIERLDELARMRQSLYDSPKLGAMLSNGDTEHAIFWYDNETGALLKTKPDYVNHNVNSVFDLKTTQEASRESFSRAIGNFGYHIQGAMAVDGLKELKGDNYQVVNVAVEKTAPYCVGNWEIKFADLEHGRNEYKKAIKLYQKCMAENYWPSYSEYTEDDGSRASIQQIDLPGYLINQYQLEQYNAY